MTQSHNRNVSPLKLISAFGAVYFIWGSTYLFIHFALADFRPFLMASARFLIAGALLYGWARTHGSPKPTRAQWRDCLITGACFFLGGNGAVVWSQQRLPSGIAALLVAIVPLFVVLLDWIRPPHNRPRVIVMAGVLIGLLGLVLLVGPATLRGEGRVDLVAALVLAGGSMTWAFGALFVQRAQLPRSPLLTAAMQLLCGGFLLGLASLVAGEPARMDWSSISLRPILAVLYLIFFGSILAFSAFGWLMRVAPASRVATYAYVNPVVALILGWLFAHEKLGLRTLTASAVILAGVVLITLGTAKRESGQTAWGAVTRD